MFCALLVSGCGSPKKDRITRESAAASAGADKASSAAVNERPKEPNNIPAVPGEPAALGDDCFTETETPDIKRFIGGMIKEMRAGDYKALSHRMLDQKRFDEALVEERDRIEGTFLAIHEVGERGDNNDAVEDGKWVPFFAKDASIYRTPKEGSPSCMQIQVYFPSGMYFDLIKVGGKIQISRYDVAG